MKFLQAVVIAAAFHLAGASWLGAQNPPPPPGNGPPAGGAGPADPAWSTTIEHHTDPFNPTDQNRVYLGEASHEGGLTATVVMKNPRDKTDLPGGTATLTRVETGDHEKGTCFFYWRNDLKTKPPFQRGFQVTDTRTSYGQVFAVRFLPKGNPPPLPCDPGSLRCIFHFIFDGFIQLVKDDSHVGPIQLGLDWRLDAPIQGTPLYTFQSGVNEAEGGLVLLDTPGARDDATTNVEQGQESAVWGDTWMYRDLPNLAPPPQRRRYVLGHFHWEIRNVIAEHRQKGQFIDFIFVPQIQKVKWHAWEATPKDKDVKDAQDRYRDKVFEFKDQNGDPLYLPTQ